MDWTLDSELIDRTLGFRVVEIERQLLGRALAIDPDGNHHSWGSALHEGNQTWVGLHPETIQTPYHELLRVCEKLRLKDGDHVVDFGAGYGRLGLVLHDRFPRVSFHGIEYVKERVTEGKRVYGERHLPVEGLSHGDLTADNFFPEEADHYFIYDFGKVPHIRRLLNQLSEIADKRKFQLAGRGKGVRSLIAHEYPWLTAFDEEENFSLYSF